MANEKLFYSYDQIHTLIKQGSHTVLEDNFNPDLILAIGGGGFIPGRILRNYINVPIVSLTMNFYNDKEEIQDKPNIEQMIDKSIVAGKRVLIVDEVDDTRKTLAFLLDYFAENGYEFEKLGIFVVHNKIKPKSYTFNGAVKYYSCVEVEDKWVVYPWDRI